MNTWECKETIRRPEVQSHEPVIKGWIGWPSYGVDKLPGGKLPCLITLQAKLLTTCEPPDQVRSVRPRRATDVRPIRIEIAEFISYPESIDGCWLFRFGFGLSHLSTKEQEENCKE
jgi:hypothetical protein